MVGDVTHPRVKKRKENEDEKDCKKSGKDHCPELERNQ